MSDISDDESQPPRDRPPTPGKDIVIVPRVGTVVQRGDRETARRIAAIATPPPPPAKRRREGPKSPPPPVTLQEPACAAIITDTDIAVPVGVGTEARPRDAAAAGTWRVPRIAKVEPPTGPPPVRVVLPTGRAVDIPFYAVHRSRKYKLRIAGERWIM